MVEQEQNPSAPIENEIVIENDPIPDDVDVFVLDFDNFTVNTSDPFIETIQEFGELLIKVYGDEEKGNAVCDEFQWESYNEKGKYKGIVDMRVKADSFVGDLALRGDVDFVDAIKLKQCLKGIYKKDLQAYPGAHEFVRKLYNSGKKIVVYTHSGEEWGKRKVRKFMEDAGVPFEDIILEAIPMSEKKDRARFIALVEKLEKKLHIPRSRMIVMGDNPETDIEVAEGILLHAVWLNMIERLKKGHKFRKEEIKDMPSLNVRIVSNLYQIIELL